MKTDTCGCCEGIHKTTPLETANRPGLDALIYRVGTYAAFFETMKARLSNLYLDIAREDPDAKGKQVTDRIYPLLPLTTRAQDDAAIAFLDCWAIVADVLTFYQERIANEGFLRTAVERLSILELARLIGYELRPGVSASVFLAYTIDTTTKEAVIIPAGSKAQSIPDPGENPQSFETSAPLEARAAWNNLQPRKTRPQIHSTILNGVKNRIYLKGTATNLSQNDPLLIDFGDAPPQLFRVVDISPDALLDKTLVTLADWHMSTLSEGVFKARILKLTRRLQDTSMLTGSTAKAEMVGRVVEHLKTLESQAKSGTLDSDVASFLTQKTIPSLEEELTVAESDVKYRKVMAWLVPLVRELRSAAGETATSTLLTSEASAEGSAAVAKVDPVAGILGKLTLPTSIPPRNTLYLPRDLKTSFAAKADIATQIISTVQPTLGRTLSTALSHGRITQKGKIRAYALRVKASVFGNNAPLKITSIQVEKPPQTEEWNAEDLHQAGEQDDVIFLDAPYEKITPDSWVVLDMAAVDDGRLNGGGRSTSGVEKVQNLIIAQARNPNAQLSRAAYGISGKTTRIQLAAPDGTVQQWFRFLDPVIIPVEGPSATAVLSVPHAFEIIRRTSVFAQSEELPLAEEPIEEPLCKGADNWIELDGWYADLKSGRSLIVSGERTDISVPDPDNPDENIPVTGVTASEPVMLAEVIQDVSTESGSPEGQQVDNDFTILPNEKSHTFVKFANNLQYCYSRDTVTIYGNVVRATHGETRKEVLGSGDGSQKLQSFTLRQPPLTFVPAPNPKGVNSTLAIYVNDVQWHETDSLAALGPTDRKFITQTDDDAKTRVIFGNGEHGARLPTGVENVRAGYRNGIGKAGNVKAEQISLLLSRPLGVKGVINPLPASGGADKEDRDQARSNAPLAVTALDRLVSIQDYADFSRTFAGIGKSCATLLAVDNRQLVHVTIAGADDIPIDTTSDLYRNLLGAIRSYGAPHQPFQVDLRELMLLVASANISILEDYIWDTVATEIRTRVVETFGFGRRDLGQDVFLSEIISTMQAVPGVAYVDIDLFGAIHEKKADQGVRRLLTPDEITRSIGDLLRKREQEQGLPDAEKSQPATRIAVGPAMVDDGTIQPARLAIFSPDLPDTLILNRV